MIFTQRIPTAQYAYIEFETEYASVEDAMSDHKRITKLYEDQGSLSHSEWVKVRNNMLATGEFDPNLSERLSAPQKWWVNETKLALRSHEADEPVIN
jgi:hypothetical protein